MGPAISAGCDRMSRAIPPFGYGSWTISPAANRTTVKELRPQFATELPRECQGLAHRRQHAVQCSVALVQPGFHSRLQHPIAILGGQEQRRRNKACSSVAEIFERHGFEGDVAWHAVPLECLHDSLRRRHFGKTSFEAMHAVIAVLDKTPMAAAFQFQPLDVELVPSAPPLRDQLGIRHRLPHSLARGVEDSLDADIAVAGCGNLGLHCRFLLCDGCHRFSFLRSRNSPSRSRRPSSIRRYVAIHAASSSSRRGPSLQRRTRPTFSVVTSPAASSTPTCFFMPVSVISKASASSVIPASDFPSRSRTPRRVGSASAPNALLSLAGY